jgi:hypothetical protein
VCSRPALGVPKRTSMLASEEARSSTVLLTGPFGGLTDDVREFLLCLADDACP